MGLFKTATGLLFVALLPTIFEFLLRKEYAVHESGNVLITGSSSGIGLSACLKLVELEKFTVYCGVRKQKDADKIKSLSGGKAETIILDVTNEEHIVAAVEAMENTGKPFVGLVNNAGVSNPFTPMEFLKMSDLRWVMDVNYFGAMSLTKAFLPLLRKSKGRVISVSSMAGATPGSYAGGPYSASKYALEATSDSLRNELSPHGVSVSLLQPAFVKSEIINTASSKIEKATAEQLKLYPKAYNGQLIKMASEFMAQGDDPDTTTSMDIIHAMTSPYPKTRYVNANIGGMPAWVIKRIMWMTPDRLADLMMAAM